MSQNSSSTVLTVSLRFGHNKRTRAPGWLLEVNNVRRMDVGNAVRADMKEWVGILEEPEVFDHDPKMPKITLFVGQRLSSQNVIPVEPATSILGILAKFGYKVVGSTSLSMGNGTGIPDQAIWTLQP